MKTAIRLVSLLLAVVMLFSITVGCKKKESAAKTKTPSVEFTYETDIRPLTGSVKDKNFFMHNPDRGFRTDVTIYVDQYLEYVGNESKMMSKLGGTFSGYFNNPEPCSIAFAYVYLTKWHLEELPDEALEVVKSIFEYCRIKKYKLMLSICYNNNYAINCNLSQANKDKLATECADEATILKHIDQLAPLIAEYKDCIFTIKNGFIGFVGEWAESFQWPPVNYDKVTMAIVDKLCAPNGLYFSHRHPSYTDSVRKKYPDWENIKWIGFNNCAFYGEQSNKGWNSGGFQLGDKDGWWEYICKTGARYPVTGELYTSNAMNRYNAIVTGKQAILELAHHWHVTLSFWHGKYDIENDTTGLINIMEEWEKQEINKEWLDAQGIIYDPNWFVDDNGNPVARDCYEFIRDHLGYKIVAENIKADAKDGKIKLDMTFKNYGFSAAFNLTSGFAILNDKYEIVSETVVGDPREWYSHDPDNWQSNEVLTHTLSGEVDAPTESGKYYVAFFLRNSYGVGACLSNNTGDVKFENECNILFEFEV